MDGRFQNLHETTGGHLLKLVVFAAKFSWEIIMLLSMSIPSKWVNAQQAVVRYLCHCAKNNQEGLS